MVKVAVTRWSNIIQNWILSVARCVAKEQRGIATHMAQLGCEEDSGGRQRNGEENNIRPEKTRVCIRRYIQGLYDAR